MMGNGNETRKGAESQAGVSLLPSYQQENLSYMRLLKALSGYRDDLALEARWWHRAINVLIALILLAVFATVLMVSRVKPRVGTDEMLVVENLSAFIEKNPTAKDALGPFERLGETAKLNDDGTLSQLWLSPFEIFCSGDLRQSGEELAKFLRSADPENHLRATPESAMKWLENAGGPGAGNCVELNAANYPPLEKIVAAQPAAAAVAKRWAWAVAIAAGVTLTLAMLVFNAYHRVLLYVVFGRRKSNWAS